MNNATLILYLCQETQSEKQPCNGQQIQHCLYFGPRNGRLFGLGEFEVSHCLVFV